MNELGGGQRARRKTRCGAGDLGRESDGGGAGRCRQICTQSLQEKRAGLDRIAGSVRRWPERVKNDCCDQLQAVRAAAGQRHWETGGRGRARAGAVRER